MGRTKSKTSRYHVPNLERALEIMELLTEHPEGLTTTEITDLLHVPRNSVFRITATLQNYGYLNRQEDSKAFQLSQKLLTLGYSAITDQTLIEKALDPMRKLRDRFKETVPLGILHGTEGLIVEEMQGTHSFRFVLEPGKTFHLHTAAPGKALVAFLPEDERGSLIKKLDYKVFNDRTVKNAGQFMEILKIVQQKGYAVDMAEEIEGMHCIGAPIFNRHAYPVAAIWITGPSHRIKESDIETIADEVKRTALLISRSLGFRKNLSSRVPMRKPTKT